LRVKTRQLPTEKEILAASLMEATSIRDRAREAYRALEVKEGRLRIDELRTQDLSQRLAAPAMEPRPSAIVDMEQTLALAPVTGCALSVRTVFLLELLASELR